MGVGGYPPVVLDRAFRLCKNIEGPKYIERVSFQQNNFFGDKNANKQAQRDHNCKTQPMRLVKENRIQITRHIYEVVKDN